MVVFFLPLYLTGDIGLFTLTFSLSMVISPVSGTWVYNHFGPHVLWFGAGCIGMLVWVGLKAFGNSAWTVRSD